MSEASIRVVLIDDHGIVRQGLRSILELDHTIEVVGEAGDTPEGIELLAALQPDIVLLDLSIGRHGPARGLDACQTISTQYPHVNVIVLTTFMEEHLALQAMRNGAKGYLLKDVDAVDLIRMLKAVQRGEAALDTRITPFVLKQLRSHPTGPAVLDLTQREKDVIRHVAAGSTNREIGTQLSISQSTVKYHLRNIMHKLNVNHRTEVVYAATKLGLV